jgi:type II secretory pathway component GspD/PulD (secretin)
MTFKNDAPEWRTYHSGGTLKVRTATSDRVGLDDIDYGLIMKVKGGLTDSRTVALEVELELSYPSPVGTDYDLKRNKIQTTVMCDLNQTLVMGGMKSLIEQSSREGVPFLRSIPVVQWMFSEKMEQKQDSTVLILMSPRIMGAPVETTPVSAETVGVQEEAARSTDEIERERRGRKRRFFFF